MPKIVDKEQRRREIASKCNKLIYDIGIKKLTVAQVAKTAGIGKGTIYEYFENKEDIIFEIINIHVEEYSKKFLEDIKHMKTTKEKMMRFFDFVTNNTEENLRHFTGYKEYLSVVLSEENEDMKKYNVNCNIFFHKQMEDILKEGVEKKELKKDILNFVDVCMAFEKGAVLMKMTDEHYDAKTICENFIDSFLETFKENK